MYPVYFLDNKTCVNCGKESIEFLNEFNRDSNPMSKDAKIYTARCANCNAEYIVHWDTENNLYRLGDKKETINNFQNKFIDTSKKREINNFI